MTQRTDLFHAWLPLAPVSRPFDLHDAESPALAKSAQRLLQGVHRAEVAKLRVKSKAAGEALEGGSEVA